MGIQTRNVDPRCVGLSGIGQQYPGFFSKADANTFKKPESPPSRIPAALRKAGSGHERCFAFFRNP
jgi:hypothetical protein